MSMAIGEYVSVHSQADSEAAALDQERTELAADPDGEHRELTEIYVHRGLDAGLAKRVAEQLMAHDALAAHARDELGFSARSLARPLQAASASAASFISGAAVPLLAAAVLKLALPHPPHRWHLAVVLDRTRRLVGRGGRCRHEDWRAAHGRVERLGDGRDGGRRLSDRINGLNRQ